MGTNTFLVLINQRSGGQDGPQLLDRFRQLAQEGLDGQEHLEVTLTRYTPSYLPACLLLKYLFHNLDTSLISPHLPLFSGCFDD